jgi:sulfur carrier protein
LVSDSPDSIAIQLNGEPYKIEGETGVEDLLKKLDLRPARVAVELNGEIVPKNDYGRTTLKSGDSVEIINFVGGG